MMSNELSIAVFGSTGQLGGEIVDQGNKRGHRMVPISRTKETAIRCTEICQSDKVVKAASEADCDVLVNCAAFHDESECRKNPAYCYNVNANGSFNVARTASLLGAMYVYISTDYVFGADKNDSYQWDASYCPLPDEVYPRAKIAGEIAAEQCASRSLICRTSTLFGERECTGKPRANWIDQVIYGLLEDSYDAYANTLTNVGYVPDVASSVLDAIKHYSEWDGDGHWIEHCVNSGSASHYSYARAVYRYLLNIGYDVELYEGHPPMPRRCALVPTTHTSPRTGHEAIEAHLKRRDETGWLDKIQRGMI